MTVRVLADDLTGTLDASACFAGAHQALPVYWHLEAARAEHGDLGLDIETRDLPEAAAIDRLDAHLPDLAAAGTAFKKIDSLMRGNTAAEMAACARSPRFRSVVLAPAFPAQRRITRQGQQLAWRDDVNGWRAVGSPLHEALLGHKNGRVIHATRGHHLAGSGVFICDAETEDDLASIANAAPRLEPPILWCGTAGLAHALAGPAKAALPPRASRILAVVGSRHSTSLTQIREVYERWPGSLVDAAPNVSDSGIAWQLGQTLDRHGLAVLVQGQSAASVAEVDTRLARLLAIACPAIDIDACVASGGITLRILLDAAGCHSVMAEGEIEPGVPLARIRGGRWNGTALVSKAGAFGEAAALLRLMKAMRGKDAS